MNFCTCARMACFVCIAFCVGAYLLSNAAEGNKNTRKKGKLAASKVIAFCIIAVDGVATVWVLVLCTLAVLRGFTGSLPYLTTLIGALQGATAYILGHYYKKSAAENRRGGVVYESAMKNPTPDV